MMQGKESSTLVKHFSQPFHYPIYLPTLLQHPVRVGRELMPTLGACPASCVLGTQDSGHRAGWYM
eukprot:3021825-Ditylum_brightwellii.AAC.1